MSANLYATKTPGAYYHIHGSLEASKTLGMIGLPPYRPDLKTVDDIAEEIESHVKQFTIEELEERNKELRQAGVIALKHEDFIQTPHVGSDGLQFLGILLITASKGQSECWSPTVVS